MKLGFIKKREVTGIYLKEAIIMKKAIILVSALVIVGLIGGCSGEQQMDTGIAPPTIMRLSNISKDSWEILAYDKRTKVVYLANKIEYSKVGFTDYLSERLNHYKYDETLNIVYEVDKDGQKLEGGDVIKANTIEEDKQIKEEDTKEEQSDTSNKIEEKIK